MKSIKLTASIADIASRSPSENLGPGSRFVVAADLRMGDGGKKDELAVARKALFRVLGRWYLPRGYTLVLNGDVEDLRNFWLKDVLAAWPEMYALFDAYAESGRLRKILGERDLSLLRLRSYPYELAHSLRLDVEGRSMLVLHGHQAASPFVGREYLSDFIPRWLRNAKRPKDELADEDRRERFRAERRLCRSSSRLGIVAIEGHTRRPLFESLTMRDSIRFEVERLLREGDTRGDRSTLDALVRIYGMESRKSRGARRMERLSLSRDSGCLDPPCLFCPGRVLGARGLRLIEIEGDALRLVRWSRDKGAKASSRAAEDLIPSEDKPRRLEGSPFMRFEMRSASIRGLFERIEARAPVREDTMGDTR